MLSHLEDLQICAFIVIDTSILMTEMFHRRYFVICLFTYYVVVSIFAAYHTNM
jgi:hypothetical protein